MRLKNIFQGIVFLLLITGISISSVAGGPMEAIKETTDKIIAILSDPELKAPEKASERDRLIRKEVDELFDWVEMSRRALARHWRKRTKQEKKEFIDLFGKLLERTYRDKVHTYSGEKFIYLGDKVDGDYGIGKVKIVTEQGTEIPVKYRVKRKGNSWYVYDVSIEGVSLINNYRTQFNTIMVRSSYKELVEKLKAKIAEK